MYIMNNELLIKMFLADKEDVTKIMVGNKIFYPYTTKETDIKAYNNYIDVKYNFKFKHHNQPYMHCRIFTVENVDTALELQKLVDDYFIFTYEKDIIGKYSVIEQEIFVLYSNPYFIDIFKKLYEFEYINGFESKYKDSILKNLYSDYIDSARLVL